MCPDEGFPRQICWIYILHLTGNMAAFDMDDPKAVVSPGGVGFDINCGVRRKTSLSMQLSLD